MIFRGYKTEGMAKGQVATFPNVYEITGTEKVGAKEYMVVEPIAK
jgi:hypothetical protein